MTGGVSGGKLLGLKDSGPNEQLSLAALKMLVRRSERQKIPKHNSTRTEPPVSHQTHTHAYTHQCRQDYDLCDNNVNFELGVIEEMGQ